MTGQPSFSVIVPVYGVEKYIERCARSLFGQTYGKIQFIFVNDGTEDRSIEILDSLIDSEFPHLKDRTVIVNKENAGLPAARKTGLEYASGDYILHVDSDDYIENCAVEKIASEAERTDADLIYFDLVVEYPGRKSFRREKDYDAGRLDSFVVNLLNGKSYGYLCTKCFKRSIYDESALYFAPFPVYEDMYSSIQLIYRSKSASHLKECLYHYDRSNAGSFTAKDRSMRHYHFCANMLDLYGHFAGKIIGSPMEAAAPALMYRVAWYCCRHKFGFFADNPELPAYVASAPLGTDYYIPVFLQIFLKMYVKFKFMNSGLAKPDKLKRN